MQYDGIDERWQFLEEWAYDLRTLVSYEAREEIIYGTLHDRIDYLRLNLGDPAKESGEIKESGSQQPLTDDQRWSKLCRLWEFLHEGSWQPWYPFLYDVTSAEISPRWQLGFVHSDRTLGDSPAALADAVDLLTRISPDVLRPEYHAAKLEIQELVGNAWDDAFRIPLSLVFVSQPSDQDHTRWISVIHELVRTLSDPTSIAGRAFCLDTVSVSLATLPVMAFTEELVTKFVYSHVAVPQLTLGLQLNDALSIASTINTVSVIGPDGRYGDQRFVEELVLEGSSGASQFAAWCSGVARSQCLRRLYLRKTFADLVAAERSLQWRWLAYALSKRHWKSSVCHLRIDEELLRMDDVESFVTERRKKQTSDHLRELQPLQPPGEQDSHNNSQAVQLYAASPIRLSGGKVVDLESLGWGQDDAFLVLHDDFPSANEEDGEWIAVLVPGFGRCMVECESVASAHGLATTGNTRVSLQSLQLHLSRVDSPCALPLFVQAMGATLTHVSIVLSDANVTLEPTAVRAMLAQCPVLSFLALRRVNVATMDVFRDAYRTQPPQCRVSVLSLWNVWVDNASLTRFALELADATSTLSVLLQDFRYIYDDLDDHAPTNRPDEQGIQAFLKMLESNRTLTFFELGIEETLRDTYLGAFAALDKGRDIPTVPRAIQLALLSVLTGRHESDGGGRIKVLVVEEHEDEGDNSEPSSRRKIQKHAVDSRNKMTSRDRAWMVPLVWSFVVATSTRKRVLSPTRIA